MTTLEDLKAALTQYLATPATLTVERCEVARMCHALTTSINAALDGDRAAHRAAIRAHFANQDCDE